MSRALNLSEAKRIASLSYPSILLLHGLSIGCFFGLRGVSMNSAENHEQLVALASESWRLAKQFQRAIDVSEASVAQRQSSQVRYFQKRMNDILGEAGLQLVDLEGQPFDAGAAVAPLNGSDFGPDEDLVIDQMLEPTIMDRNGVRRVGTCMLRKR